MPWQIASDTREAAGTGLHSEDHAGLGGAQHLTETEVTHRSVGIPEAPARRLCASAFDFPS